MKKLLVVLSAAAMVGVAGGVHADGNAQAGKAKAAGCAGCHGANGAGTGAAPKLAGHAPDKFAEAMKDYRSGKRKHAVMNSLASKQKDQDIDDLAAYYASLK